MRLTQEEKEQLKELADSGALKAVTAFVNVKLKHFEERVLRTSIQSGAREIVIAKAQLDGAIALAKSISNIKADLKENS